LHSDGPNTLDTGKLHFESTHRAIATALSDGGKKTLAFHGHHPNQRRNQVKKKAPANESAGNE
jgi:hypothetical protein